MDIPNLNSLDSDSDINPRIIINPVFNPISNESVNLTDPVFVYSDGKSWKIIPLNISLVSPIIYDNFYDSAIDNNSITKICIYICPFSLFSVIYFGEFISFNKVYNNNLVLKDSKENEVIIPSLDNIYKENSDTNTYTLIDKIIRKNEIRIMTLRNAISKYPDCLYIDNSYLNKFDPIVPLNYIKNDQIFFPNNKFNNQYHPKTIIYIIEYKSKRTHSYKKTVLLTIDASSDSVNTVDIVKNGFDVYFQRMSEKIRNRGGLIYPCFWFVWNGIYPDSKVIKL